MATQWALNVRVREKVALGITLRCLTGWDCCCTKTLGRKASGVLWRRKVSGVLFGRADPGISSWLVT